MSNKVIGYDNQLWRVEQEFSYTGTDQPFTLEPGTYLFICEGAHGGIGSRGIKEYGGVALGEITLDETTTFHAVVGSNGGDGNLDYTKCVGGFNGGAHGGMGYTGFGAGPGGGGATDIRLLPYDSNEYPTYDENGNCNPPVNTITVLKDSEWVDDDLAHEYVPLEYIYAWGSNNSGYFNTEYIPKAETKIEMECVVYENTIQPYEILFGARNGSYENNAYVFFSRFNSNNVPVYGRSGNEAIGSDFIYNELIKLICYQEKAEWFLGGVSKGSITTTGTIDHCINPLLINTSNQSRDSSVQTEGSWAKFKLYSFKISESQTKYRYTEYQPVEYIESDGTQYIDTGYLHQPDDWYIPVVMLIRSGNTVTDAQVIFGFGDINTSGTDANQVAVYMYENYFHQLFAVSAGTNTQYSSTDESSIYDIKLSIDVFRNNIVFYRVSDSGFLGRNINSYSMANVTGETSLALFGKHFTWHNREGSPETFQGLAMMRFYEMTIWSDYTQSFYDRSNPVYIKHHYYPVRRISDGVLGILDTVTGEFMTSPVGNAFKCGNDINTINLGEDYCEAYIEEVQMRDYVPARRQSDNVVGLFDIANHTFITQTGNGYWEPGPPKCNTPSLHSRIMVAGGGGGEVNQSEEGSINDGFGWGGGPHGSIPAALPSLKDPWGNIYPSQTNGYAFGYGAFPSSRANASQVYGWSSEGAGGAGGGWYGGCASIIGGNINTEHASVNGGGGSGYVLTESSYKPSGYNPSSKYYFTKTLLHGGTAMGDFFSDNPNDWNNGHVYICKPTTKLQQGDVIVYPSTGKATHHELPSGQYQLKCWGGDGGARRFTSHCSRGGYSEGVVETDDTHEIYVYTGGSGWPFSNFGTSDEQSNLITTSSLSSLGFNGGHHIQNLSTVVSKSGGASDIRFDEDDLYHRVIVAGGGGSEGMHGNVGGSGGGISGGNANGSYGTNNGPGTQTSGYAFGDGGLGYYQSNGYGGCGGSGWYGGYGTTPDSGDNDKSGAGGSGFVLTKDSVSYVPSEYGCGDSEYYLTQAQTVQGGNNLPIAHTKVQIEVLELKHKCLCQDSDGYKYFDKETQSWTLLPTQSITAETFETYGSSIKSDTELRDTYTVLVYDESHTASIAKLNVTPNTQSVSSMLDVYVLSVINTEVEDEYPEGIYQSWVQTKSVNVNNESKTKVTLYIDKLQNVDAKYTAYYSQILAAKTAHGNEYLKLDEKGNRIFKHFVYDEDGNMTVEERTMELKPQSDFINEFGEVSTAQWLLPVMTKNNIPVVYNNQVIDGDVTTIYITMIGQYARTIYFAYICNVSGVSNSQLIIKAMNFTTGDVVNVCRLDWLTIDGNESSYYTHTLLIDENYFYLIEAYNSANRQKIIRIHKTTFVVSTTDSCGEDICAYGKMKWYDNNTILCVGKQHVNLFDTTQLIWKSYLLTENSDKYDWCIGKKYLLWTKSRNQVYIYDIENDFAFVKTMTFSIGGSAGTSLVMFYHDGTFYVMTCGSNSTGGYIHFLDEETLTITKSRVTSGLIRPYECQYCNGGIMISQYNDYRLLCYDIDADQVKSVYTPWRTTYWKQSQSVYIPFVLDGVYFWLMNTLLILNYSPSSKYNFGQKYNLYYTYYGESYEDGLEYDERFITITPSGLEFHNGFLEYPLSEYNQNHIATVVVNKSSYKYLINTIIE